MGLFFLVDCNNFYVSCERLFAPHLQEKPVIVLSNNDGCVVARSQEAKQLNIQMGEPFFKIRDFCHHHHVTVQSSNYEFYGDISQRVMQILREYASEMEVYSIDEAFLYYPSPHFEEIPWEIATSIKKKVKKQSGIPVSIGIAPTKTLAKLANHLAKKNREIGIFDLSSFQKVKNSIENIPIGDVWGIGRQTQTKLHSWGVFTIGQFCALESLFVRKKLGVIGEKIFWELHGIPCLALESPDPKKSITCSRSFGKNVTDPNELTEALATYVNSACIRLRDQHSSTQAIYVFLEALIDSKTGTRSHECQTLAFLAPTNDTSLIMDYAKIALLSLFRKGIHYKKCGIILLDIIEDRYIALDLFQPKANPKRELLMKTYDQINSRFGKNTLFYASMGTHPQWKMRSDKHSRRYTTNWNELPIAFA